jgi:hypothetical protein
LKFKKLYCKALFYSSTNKLAVDTLRFQIESLKLTTLHSLKLLMTHDMIKAFTKSRDIGLNAMRNSDT